MAAPDASLLDAARAAAARAGLSLRATARFWEIAFSDGCDALYVTRDEVDDDEDAAAFVARAHRLDAARGRVLAALSEAAPAARYELERSPTGDWSLRPRDSLAPWEYFVVVDHRLTSLIEWRGEGEALQRVLGAAGLLDVLQGRGVDALLAAGRPDALEPASLPQPGPVAARLSALLIADPEATAGLDIVVDRHLPPVDDARRDRCDVLAREEVSAFTEHALRGGREGRLAWSTWWSERPLRWHRGDTWLDEQEWRSIASRRLERDEYPLLSLEVLLTHGPSEAHRARALALLQRWSEEGGFDGESYVDLLAHFYPAEEIARDHLDEPDGYVESALLHVGHLPTERRLAFSARLARAALLRATDPDDARTALVEWLTPIAELGPRAADHLSPSELTDARQAALRVAAAEGDALWNVLGALLAVAAAQRWSDVLTAVEANPWTPGAILAEDVPLMALRLSLSDTSLLAESVAALALDMSHPDERLCGAIAWTRVRSWDAP
jgi:hypothetical protein